MCGLYLLHCNCVNITSTVYVCIIAITLFAMCLLYKLIFKTLLMFKTNQHMNFGSLVRKLQGFLYIQVLLQDATIIQVTVTSYDLYCNCPDNTSSRMINQKRLRTRHFLIARLLHTFSMP